MVNYLVDDLQSTIHCLVSTLLRTLHGSTVSQVPQFNELGPLVRIGEHLVRGP